MNDEERRKRIANVIADAIQQLLKDSDELSTLLTTAKEEGYDIFLTVFSGIMIRRRENARVQKDDGSLPLKFEFTDFDKEFLQSIGIKVPEN